MSPKSIAALVSVLCAPVLTACDDADLDRGLKLLTGQYAEMHNEFDSLQDELAALKDKDHTDPAVMAEMDDIRARLSELAGTNDQEEPTAPPGAARYAPNGIAYGGSCTPGVDSIFRVATCSDDGIMYELDGNMNWIIP